MRYHQIAWVERYRIGGLVAVGECPAAIARHVGRHRSTILRELRRNGGRGGSYQPEAAQEQAARRRGAASRRSHFAPAERLVRGLLERQWSPAQVAGHLHRTGPVAISHERIYRYIWADKFAGGALYRHLRGRQRPRLKRGRYHDPRGRMPRKRLLRDRPAIVADRRRVGDWEIDTVLGHGSPDCVVTLVERKTGYRLLGKLPARTSAALNRRVRQLLRRSSRPVWTITADNGSELDGYPALEAATGARFYFAPPYHAWVRGTNENTNGLVRQYLPRGASMKGLTQRTCTAIAARLNRRPRHRLGFRTPEECYVR